MSLLLTPVRATCSLTEQFGTFPAVKKVLTEMVNGLSVAGLTKICFVG